MSLELAAIKKRHADLLKLAVGSLEASNATEFYKQDVGDLLKVVDALTESLARQLQRNEKLQGKEVDEFEVYVAGVRAGIGKFIRGGFQKTHPELKVVQ